MQNWFNLFPRNISLSIYVWVIFSLLPFYFIFQSNSLVEVLIGIVLIVFFFAAYLLSFLANGRYLYVGLSIMILISVGMSIYYGYVYFSLFIAYFIGNIKHKGGFISLYVIHLVFTVLSSALSFFTQNELFYSQWPFLILTVLGAVLLPISTYNRLNRQRLEAELLDANKRISQLLVNEERQRIARDLHDTLGQKLTLIGLKSDLAKRILPNDIKAATLELDDIHQTARTALNEVRDVLRDMRGLNLKEEIKHVKQLLKTAQIECSLKGPLELTKTPALVEDVASMCLKEAVTNIVKHSQASQCHIEIDEKDEQIVLIIEDNGIGINLDNNRRFDGHGLKGMAERLEFVNGDMKIVQKEQGTRLEIFIPNVYKQVKQEVK